LAAGETPATTIAGQSPRACELGVGAFSGVLPERFISPPTAESPPTAWRLPADVPFPGHCPRCRWSERKPFRSLRPPPTASSRGLVSSGEHGCSAASQWLVLQIRRCQRPSANRFSRLQWMKRPSRPRPLRSRRNREGMTGPVVGICVVVTTAG